MDDKNPDWNGGLPNIFESIWLQSALKWTQYINTLFKLLLDNVHKSKIPPTLWIMKIKSTILWMRSTT